MCEWLSYNTCHIDPSFFWKFDDECHVHSNEHNAIWRSKLQLQHMRPPLITFKVNLPAYWGKYRSQGHDILITSGHTDMSRPCGYFDERLNWVPRIQYKISESQNVNLKVHYIFLKYSFLAMFHMTNNMDMYDANWLTDGKHTFVKTCLVDDENVNQIGEVYQNIFTVDLSIGTEIGVYL